MEEQSSTLSAVPAAVETVSDVEEMQELQPAVQAASEGIDETAVVASDANGEQRWR